ncbi:MAG: DUF5320 domain-containing protein [Candidatus Cloacimonadaceae bacterium]|nr:DUF5320 domain-containing protein [Candidatus Cloacimonadota bacterium]MDX9949614.1 DUF5320 domain-containing protein [Candidatus Syntrophosphaera sp.]
MPNFDGTGPFGDGRPGRGMGPCGRSGAGARGFGPRRGCGQGRGRGFGFRASGRGRRWLGTPGYQSQEDVYPYTREDLIAQKEDLERQLQWLNDQISKEETD